MFEIEIVVMKESLTEDDIVEALFALDEYQSMHKGELINQARLDDLKNREDSAINRIKNDSSLLTKVLVKAAEKDVVFHDRKFASQEELKVLEKRYEEKDFVTFFPKLNKFTRADFDRMKQLEGEVEENSSKSNPYLDGALNKIFKEDLLAKKRIEEVLLPRLDNSGSLLNIGSAPPLLYDRLKKDCKDRKNNSLYRLKERYKNFRKKPTTFEVIKVELGAEVEKVHQANLEATNKAAQEKAENLIQQQVQKDPLRHIKNSVFYLKKHVSRALGLNTPSMQNQSNGHAKEGDHLPNM